VLGVHRSKVQYRLRCPRLCLSLCSAVRRVPEPWKVSARLQSVVERVVMPRCAEHMCRLAGALLPRYNAVVQTSGGVR